LIYGGLGVGRGFVGAAHILKYGLALLVHEPREQLLNPKMSAQARIWADVSSAACLAASMWRRTASEIAAQLA
jgi:hypothetical protein